LTVPIAANLTLLSRDDVLPIKGGGAPERFDAAAHQSTVMCRQKTFLNRGKSGHIVAAGEWLPIVDRLLDGRPLLRRRFCWTVAG
jgi:hypothetical protein